ncbi:MAG TPA: YitT family protein, partial [Firmicutes bacterium]|nr:YitT family protein [Bacillota bacterium]
VEMEVKKFFKKINKKKFFLDLIVIIIGGFISSLSYSLFLVHLKIVPGGISGVAMLLNFLFKTPIGVFTFLLNIPIFIMGWRLLGRSFALRTILGLVLSTFFIDFQIYFLKLQPLTDDKLLGCIFGGILLGSGLGIVFLGNASTGGSDIAGQIINKYTNLSTGMGIMLIDVVIITLSGFIFKNIEAVLYGYLCLYISTKVIDFVLEGTDYVKGVYIISSNEKEISEGIITEMNRGVTLLKGISVYREVDVNVIFSVVMKKEVPVLRRLVKEIDPESFMIITQVHEVLGKGFRKRQWL